MRDYAELILDLRRHHCDAKEDDTQEVCEECAYDVIVADKSKFNGITDVCTCGLMHRAADAIEELLDELTTIRKQFPRWISVEELLAERNVAFWVDTQPHLDDANYKKDGMAYYCSNCHHRAGKYKHRSYKFCPWCGAKIVPKEMAVRNED